MIFHKMQKYIASLVFFLFQEEQDAMEQDLDKAEILKANSGELSGDRLLITHYLKSAPHSARKKKVNQP